MAKAERQAKKAARVADRKERKAARKSAAAERHRKAIGAPTEKATDAYYKDYRGHRTLIPWQKGDTEEEKPAKLRVLIMDPAQGYGKEGMAGATDMMPEYTDFFLNSVDESDTEKVHLVETFGGVTWAHMFDRKPRVWVFSGMLINSSNENWASSFEYLYEHYMRGTKCAEAGAQVQLTYEGKSIYGLMLGTSRQYASLSPNSIPFTFSLLINHVELMRVGAIEDELEKAALQAEEEVSPGEAGAKADAAVNEELDIEVPDELEDAGEDSANGEAQPVVAADADTDVFTAEKIVDAIDALNDPVDDPPEGE